MFDISELIPESTRKQLSEITELIRATHKNTQDLRKDIDFIANILSGMLKHLLEPKEK